MSITHQIKKSPLVSVIIPLYNYEKYVLDCIDSVVRQDYKNIEIVLIDNKSTDNGLQVAKDKLSSCSVNYKIIENSHNLGICASLNIAVKAVKGDYTCIVYSDDLLAKGRISRHIQIFEKSTNPNITVCNGPIQTMKEDGTPTSKLTLLGSLANNEQFSFESVVTKKNDLTLLGCTFSTHVLKDLLFDENLFYDDWDFFIRLTLYNYSIVYDEVVAAHYRIKEGGLAMNIDKMIESRNKIKEKYFKIIAAKNKKLANNFVFTTIYWNLIGMSYQGHVSVWIITCIKIFIKNPINMIKNLKDIAWTFRNLLRNK
jgi:glycosyltransferase involved in cell wall biosynthesis